jgi:Flp pilus assembly protein TadD
LNSNRRIRNSDPVSHYYLGKIALETGSTDQAIAHLTSALKGDVKLAEAYRELGVAYYIAVEEQS